MKKRFLLNLLIFVTISIYAENGTCTSLDSTIYEGIITDTRIDTIKYELNDSSTVIVPVDIGKSTKVILVKEKSKIDFLNYLLPIITLFLGIWTKGVLNKKSERIRIKKAGERWTTELRSLNEPIKKQIEALETFLEKLKIKDFGTPVIDIYSSASGEVFSSLDKNELLRYIELRNSKKTFADIVKISNKAQGHISIISYLYSTLKDKLKITITNSSKFTEQFTVYLQEYGKSFNNYRAEIERQTHLGAINDSRYRDLADLYKDHITPHIEDGRFNPFDMKNDFYVPVLRILDKHRNQINVEELYNAVSGAMNCIKHLEMEREYMSESITKIIESYQDELSQLDDLLTEIESTKA